MRTTPVRKSRLRSLVSTTSAALLVAGVGLIGLASPAAAASASVSPSQSTGLDPNGATITVDGSGFTPTGPGINGVYLGIGPKSASQEANWWLSADLFAGVAWVRAIDADGTFTSSLTDLKAQFTSGSTPVDCLVVECGIYTFAAHGSSDRTQDTYTPVSFEALAPQETTTTLTTAPTTESAYGAAVTLSATITPAADGSVEFFAGGLSLGSTSASGGAASLTTSDLATGANPLTATFMPADAAAFGASTSAAISHTVTATDEHEPTDPEPTDPEPTDPDPTDPAGPPPAAVDPDPNPQGMTPVASIQGGLNPDGTATEGATLTIAGQFFAPGETVEVWIHSTPAQLGSATAAPDGTLNLQVTIPNGFTGAHSIQLISSAGVTALPITIVAAAQDETCVARSVSAATLSWGVKSSFRTYISGGIANGGWTLSGVGYNAGSFTWSGGSGSFNPDLNMGVVSYPGSVSFSGHDGVLNMTLSQVRIQVNSSSSAALIANVTSSDMSGVASTHNGIAFATISLAGASNGDSSYSVSGASTTLTAAGAQAFAGFYEAGAALDPVSFIFPLGGETTCTSATGAGVNGAGGSLASTGLTGVQTQLTWALVLVSGGAALAWAGRRRGAKVYA